MTRVTAELYDLQTKKWAPAASMATPRHSHSATLLADGTVLIAGGFWYRTGGQCVRRDFQPAQPHGWDRAIRCVEADRRDAGFSGAGTALARLSDGTVLVAGGKVGGCCAGLATADVYKPDTKTWTSVGAMSRGRDIQEAMTLPVFPNGAVLVPGGFSCCMTVETISSTADLYNPQTRSWAPAAVMSAQRIKYTGVVLRDGRALFTDGYVAEFFQQ